ncbi:MAG: hypothetical protein FJ091_05595 [Deltaproteobacteria bacterium]|nr:hypothetical protein [Deltaproteobacteria bacterium]
MLTKLDDYPVHQTPEPLAHRAASDVNAYDRYWFNGVDAGGEFYFGAALGLYPHHHVMDAHFSFLGPDGVQHSLHASRLAPKEPTHTSVGPISLTVLEPMRRLRFAAAENEHGIACDLEFVSRAPALEEPRARMKAFDSTRNLVDMTRFTQFGTWQGWVRAAGATTRIDPATTYATRDRSWGVRSVGANAPARPTAPPAFGWLWAPVHFGDECALVGYFQNPDGTRWGSSAMRVATNASPALYADAHEPGLTHFAPTGDTLEFVPRTRWVKRGVFTGKTVSGESLALEVETMRRFNMNGLGYAHPKWGHGIWQGELKVEAEVWKEIDLAPGNPFHNHIHNLVTAKLGEKRGVGVLEQILFGPLSRYGFEGFLDGSPA